MHVSRKGVSDLSVGSSDSEKINDDALDEGRARRAAAAATRTRAVGIAPRGSTRESTWRLLEREVPGECGGRTEDVDEETTRRGTCSPQSRRSRRSPPSEEEIKIEPLRPSGRIRAGIWPAMHDEFITVLDEARLCDVTASSIAAREREATTSTDLDETLRVDVRARWRGPVSGHCHEGALSLSARRVGMATACVDMGIRT